MAEQRVRKIGKAGLNHRQWKIVDDVLSVRNDLEVLYAKVAYRLGFKDGIRFLRKYLQTVRYNS